MRIEFAPLLGGWTLALLAAVGTAVLWRTWRATAAVTLSSRRRALLVGMRAIVLLAVLAALAGPTLRPGAAGEKDRPVVVLVDTSRSMGVADATNGTTRLSAALAAARRLRDECDGPVELRAFDRTTRPLADGVDPRPEGGASGIGRAVARVRNAKAIVVLSDGIETGPAQPEPPRIPVHTIALGTDLRPVLDLGIRRLAIPERLDVGTKAHVEAEILVAGPSAALADAKEVPLTLSRDGTERVVATLDCTRAGTRTVAFDLEPPREGIVRYELSLPVLDHEATALDNRRTALVEVRRPDFRVLYFSKRLDQEFRNIRREAASMPGVRFTSVIELSPGRFSVQGERPGDDLARGLPVAAQGLQRFHVVVLGAFPAAELPAPAHAALRRYVDEGGGLVWLAADDGFGRGGWNASPLAACSPLVFAASDPPPESAPLALEIPPAASRHPLALGLAPALAETRVAGLYRFGGALPGAAVIARARDAAGRSLPVIAVRESGKGRVVVLGASTFFCWRASHPAAYGLLWRHVLRHAASRDAARERLSLALDRESYEPGATAVATATVRDADLHPDASASVTGELLGLDGTRVRDVAFEPSAGEPGRFFARVELGGPGGLRLAAHAGEATREVALRVGGQPEEARVARDRDYLRALADASGGRLHEGTGDLDRLIATLDRPAPRGPEAATLSLLFDGPWALLLIFLLALAEWIVRRRLKLT